MTPGISSKFNMAKNSIKSLASEGLGGSTRATGKVAYGIKAQRSIPMFMPRNRDIGLAMRNNLDSTRYLHNMYDGRGRTSSAPSAPSNPYAEVMKWQGIMQAGQEITKGIGGIFSAIKSASTSGTETPKNPSIGTGGTQGTQKSAGENSTSVLDSMESAKSSGNANRLDAAISKAKARNTALPKIIKDKETELSNLTNETQSLKATLDKNTNIVNETIPLLENGIEALDKQIKVDQAQLDACKKNLNILENSNDNSSQNKQTLEILQSNIKKLEEKIQENQEKLKQQQQILNKYNTPTPLKDIVEQDKKKYQEQLSDIEKKQKELEILKKEQENLPNEITDYEKNLQKLQNQEDKKLISLDKEIKQKQDKIKDFKIDDEDGYSETDKKTNEKNEKIRKEIDNLKKEKEALDKQIKARNWPPEYKANDGTQFKTGFIGQTQVYFINGQEVTQAEYEAQKKKYEQPS